MSGHCYFIDTVNYHFQATLAPTLTICGLEVQSANHYTMVARQNPV